MVHPGLVFGVMVTVAIGTAIYYIFNNENPTLNYDHGQRYHPQAPLPTSGTTTRPGNRRRRNSDNCGICLDRLGVNNSKRLSCGHIFHKHCVDMWQRERSICPFCRGAL